MMLPSCTAASICPGILAANVVAVMDDLEAHGFQRGQTLGIEIDDRYLHP